MATRGQNVLSLSHLSVVLLGVALFLVNAFAVRASARVDLTEDKIWTLSDGTREVLRGLADPASIKVFWKDVPKLGDSEDDRRYLVSLLEEMRSEANGRLAVRWVDLDDKDGKKEAEDLHVQEFKTQERKEGEIRLVDTYQTVVIEHGASEPERIEPLLGRRGEYEYEIASRLHTMSRTQMPGVGLVAPRPSFDPFGGQRAHEGRFGVLSEFLRAQFGSAARTFMTLDDPVPEDVKILVVAAPESLEAKQVWHLEQFALRGGKVVLLLDPVNQSMIQQSRGVGTPVASGLEDWLAHLGLTVERAVVADFSPDGALRIPMPRQTRLGTLMEFVHYAFWPLATDIDESVPADRGVGAIPFYWAAPITVDGEKTKAAGRRVTSLVRTSPEGYRQPEIAALDQMPQRPRDEDLSTLTLAVLVEGPLDSFWKGKPTPIEEAKKEEEKKKAEEKKSEEKKSEEKKSEEKKPEDKKAEDGAAKPAEAKDAATPPPAAGAPAAAPEAPTPEAPKPEAAKPDEAKPAEPVPAEAKPEEPKAETPKPEEPKAAETKPDEAKPEEPKPSEAKPEETKPEETKPEETKSEEAKEESKEPARLDTGAITLFLVGDAELVADSPAAEWGQRLAQVRGGYDRGFLWIRNVLDWMSGSESLLALRARTDKPRAIKKLEANEQQMLTLVNVGAVPLLLAFAGLVVFLVRKLGR